MRDVSKFFARRGYTGAFEFFLKRYDSKLPPLQSENNFDTVFAGEGCGEGTLHSHRIFKNDQEQVFEKIFFKESAGFQKVKIFADYVYPELIASGIQAPAVKQIKEGERLAAVYYEFLDLNPVSAESYKNSALRYAAKIHNTVFDKTVTESPLLYKYHDLKMYRQSYEKLQTYFSRLGKGQELSEIQNYVDQNSEYVLSHGDLSAHNIYQNDIIIDWDYFGFYPLGLDYGYIISERYRLEDFGMDLFLELEKQIASEHEFFSRRNSINIPFYTSVFLFRKHLRSGALMDQLVSLLLERWQKIGD